MGEWVLIVVLSWTSGMHATGIHFKTLEACKDAAQEIKASLPRQNPVVLKCMRTSL